MKKTKPANEHQSNAKALIATAIISAVSAVLVAFITIVPQLRAGDAKEKEDLTKQLQALKQSVEEMKVSIRAGENGTSKSRSADVLAPNIQLRWAPIDSNVSPESYFAKGKLALERSDFTGVSNNDKVIFGFNKEYTGLVWGVSSNLVLFVVSGPDWQTADKKAENLMRGF